ncbi:MULTISPECIES: sulfite exporter TauE/SafE family protein [unclassified Gordonia (in: high G+C Gram-positive bacteria)]|uniref:sulfite exporter TauE/SafE family protein n=1 Tax=unclassified Gordonia (in: high G+C Gram-positive bacteria) TaxID=2657482 RepID=UPI0007EB472B|nr:MULTISPECIES: sulfite exporter TauE/SafE family protein [unclassified Gordonia (in: high G+C Gram-positive bacteria)]OBC04743.1 hypothetical protein A5786_12200 [Gordonia sp. 852002-50816_SCH5313054-a]OBC13710.1 hypothetical protein A5788_18920 [Gordonia sp. 852002-50816_SCH5313054-c]
MIDDDHAIPLTFRKWSLDTPRRGRETGRSRILAQWYSTAKGRLVILGEPGSGKSDLARRFAIDQLSSRAPDGQLAILFKLAEWDGRTDLGHWISEMLMARYAETKALTLDGSRSIADWLLAHNKVIPVFDGLDEIDGVARKRLLEILVEPSFVDLPFVMTCRTEAYRETVTSEAHVEFRKTLQEVVIDPVPLREAGRYLNHRGGTTNLGTIEEMTVSDRRSWAPVITAAEETPDAPLAQVLANPLMLTLARRVYSSGSTRPRDLLRTNYQKRTRLEDHLLDGYIDAAYRFSTITINRRGHATTVDEARKWLYHLTDAGPTRGPSRTNTVSWWRLARNVRFFRMLSTTVVALIAVVATTLALIASGIEWNSAMLLALCVAIPAVAITALSSVPEQDFRKASAAARFLYVGIWVQLPLGLVATTRSALASSRPYDIRGALLETLPIIVMVGLSFAMIAAFRVLEYRPRERITGRWSTAVRIGGAGGITFGPFSATIVMVGLFGVGFGSLVGTLLAWSAAIVATSVVITVSISSSVAAADAILLGAFTAPGGARRPIGPARRLAAIAVACSLSALPLLLAAAVAFAVKTDTWSGRIVWLNYVLGVLLIGLAFGVVFAFFPHSSQPARLRPAQRSKIGLAILAGVLVGLGAGWAATTYGTSNRPVTLATYVVLCTLVSVMAFVVGPPRGITQPLGPVASFRTDLKASTIFSAAFAIFAAVAFWPVFFNVTQSNSLAIIVGSGIAFGVAAWVSTPSGAFVVAQLFLWWCDKTPFGVMAFTQDAHERGVLRRDDNRYEFRHARLQERMFRRLPNRETQVGRKSVEFSSTRSLTAAIACLVIVSVTLVSWGVWTYRTIPDSGAYYTTAANLKDKEAGTEYATMLESARLADTLVNPYYVDEHFRTTQLSLTDDFVRGIWGKDSSAVSPYLAPSVLTSAAATFGMYQSTVGTMSIWLNILGFRSDDSAATFSRVLRATLEATTEKAGRVPRPAQIVPQSSLYFYQLPAAKADEAPAMVGAQLTGKRLVVASSTQPSDSVNARLIERALSLQTEAVERFVGTDPAEGKNLPRDADGLLAHTLNSVRRPGQQSIAVPNKSAVGTVLGPNATQLLLLTDQQASVPLFRDLGLELSASQDVGTVLRFKSLASATKFIERDMGIASQLLDSISGPDHVPNARCWHTPRGGLSNFLSNEYTYLCAVPWRRYVGTVFAKSESDARTRASAQYLLLQDARLP